VVEIAAEIVAHLRSMAKRHASTAGTITTTTSRSRRFTLERSTAALRSTSFERLRFRFEFRYLPFDDPDLLLREVQDYAARLLPEMHAVNADTGITFDELSALPGFDTGSDSAIAELGRCCNEGTVFNKVSFGAEASLFQRRHSAILCGPGHIAQAHHRTRVTLEQVERCETFLRRLIASKRPRGVTAAPTALCRHLVAAGKRAEAELVVAGLIARQFNVAVRSASINADWTSLNSLNGTVDIDDDATSSSSIRRKAKRRRANISGRNPGARRLTRRPAMISGAWSSGAALQFRHDRSLADASLAIERGRRRHLQGSMPCRRP
jgi:hypothetical protein